MTSLPFSWARSPSAAASASAESPSQLPSNITDQVLASGNLIGVDRRRGDKGTTKGDSAQRRSILGSLEISGKQATLPASHVDRMRCKQNKRAL